MITDGDAEDIMLRIEEILDQGRCDSCWSNFDASDLITIFNHVLEHKVTEGK